MKLHGKVWGAGALFAVCLSTGVSAMELKGVRMPDQITVAGQPLVLNGMGLRSATIFRINVYVAGLYLKSKTSDENAALAAAGPKQVRLQFLRGVDPGKIAGALDESLGQGKYKDKYKDAIAKLKALIPAVKEGDRMTYTFLSDSTEFAVNDTVKGTLPGGEFGKAVLSAWIGEKPPTKDLKQGLLGKH